MSEPTIKMRFGKPYAYFSDGTSWVEVETTMETANGAHPKGQLVDGNSVELTRLARERQQSSNISFGEALSQVAAERPALTLPGKPVTMEFSDSMEAHRRGRLVDGNSVELNRLARERQQSSSITFGEALSQVAAEQPALTLPGKPVTMEFSDSSGPRLSVNDRSVRLHELAKERAAAKNIPYGEALVQVEKENPDLTGAAGESQLDHARHLVINRRLAEAELQKLALARQKEKSISPDDAMREVKQENPQLLS